MSTTNQSPSTAVEAVSQLVSLLQSLSAEDRKKAISAAMILLGDPAPAPVLASAGSSIVVNESVEGISSKAAHWMTKNSVAMEQLEFTYSIDSTGIDVIASQMPGKSKKQQTIQAFLICGVTQFLRNGEPNFTDKDAKELCQKVGCLDSPNHAKYMKSLGNLVGGTKESGWKLTNPGLSAAAKLIKYLAGQVL